MAIKSIEAMIAHGIDGDLISETALLSILCEERQLGKGDGLALHQQTTQSTKMLAFVGLPPVGGKAGGNRSNACTLQPRVR